MSKSEVNCATSALPQSGARGRAPHPGVETSNLRCTDPATESLLRLVAGQALSRAGGTPLVAGNDVRILKDAGEHYPAWLAAIGTARRTVFIENYIFADDELGRELIAALAATVRTGVRVRLIYDWLGSITASRRLWRPLLARRALGPAEAGITTGVALAFLALAVIAIVWPLAVVLSLAMLALWCGISLRAGARELRAGDRAPMQ